MPNKHFNNMHVGSHKTPVSSSQRNDGVYASSTERQAMYDSTTKNTDAIQNPGAKGSGEQKYAGGSGSGKQQYGGGPEGSGTSQWNNPKSVPQNSPQNKGY